jgi:hypothetical protein
VRGASAADRPAFEEREILSKAAAWFAQETVPNSKPGAEVERLKQDVGGAIAMRGELRKIGLCSSYTRMYRRPPASCDVSGEEYA